MAIVEQGEAPAHGSGGSFRPEQRDLATRWRRLGRFATVVAVLTAPSFWVWYTVSLNLDPATALIATVLSLAAFRGLVDVVLHRFIPWPNLFGAERNLLQE